MSYNTDLQNNNTSLQEILATVNSLPEAGGSSGGGTPQIFSGFLDVTNNIFNVGFEPDMIIAQSIGSIGDNKDMLEAGYGKEGCFLSDLAIIDSGVEYTFMPWNGQETGVYSFLYNKEKELGILTTLYTNKSNMVNNLQLVFSTVTTLSHFHLSETGITIGNGEVYGDNTLATNAFYYVYAIKYS